MAFSLQPISYNEFALKRFLAKKNQQELFAERHVHFYEKKQLSKDNNNSKTIMTEQKSKKREYGESSSSDESDCDANTYYTRKRTYSPSAKNTPGFQSKEDAEKESTRTRYKPDSDEENHDIKDERPVWLETSGELKNTSHAPSVGNNQNESTENIDLFDRKPEYHDWHRHDKPPPRKKRGKNRTGCRTERINFDQQNDGLSHETNTKNLSERRSNEREYAEGSSHSTNTGRGKKHKVYKRETLLFNNNA